MHPSLRNPLDSAAAANWRAFAETQQMGYHRMPTVHREAGFQIKVLLPPREHGPPHVHVSRAGGVAIINLPHGKQPLSLRAVYAMKDSDVLAAVRLVEENAEKLFKAWRKYHGGPQAE